MTDTANLPDRIVVGANGAYWRDFGDHYSMCPVSTDNDPVEPVSIYVRASSVPTKLELREVIAAYLRTTEPFAWTDGVAGAVHSFLLERANHGESDWA